MRMYLTIWFVFTAGFAAPARQTADIDSVNQGHLAAARLAEQAHDYAEAGRQYEEILKTQPKLALIHQSLAVTYHLRNQFPQAIAEFQRALSLDPTLFGSCLFLGMDYYKSNQFKLAIAPLEKSIQLNAALAEPEARFWLAATYSVLGRNDDAVRELRRDLVLRPKDSDVLYYLVKAYDQSSAAAFEAIGKVEPRSAAVALLQGERLSEEGRLDLAGLEYRKAAALRPDFANWIPAQFTSKEQVHGPQELVISAFDAQANLNLAALFDAAGDSTRAGAVRQSLRLLKPASPEAGRLIAQAANVPSSTSRTASSPADLSRGLDLFRQGQFKQAEQVLSELAKQQHSSPSLRLLLVRSSLEAGDLSFAEEHLRRTLAGNPSDPDALHLLGRTYKLQAEITLNQLSQLDPDFYGVHELLGKRHEERTEYEQAIAEYQAALAKRQDLAGIRYAIGNVYRKMSKYDDAEHWLQAELERNPYHGLAHFRLGSICLEQGKLDESITHLEQALRAHPGLVDAQMDLGRAYVLKNRFDEAIVLFRKVAAAEPDNDRVHYLLSTAYVKQGNRTQAQQELAEYQRLTRNRLQNTQQDVKSLSDSLNSP